MTSPNASETMPIIAKCTGSMFTDARQRLQDRADDDDRRDRVEEAADDEEHERDEEAGRR